MKAENEHVFSSSIFKSSGPRIRLGLANVISEWRETMAVPLADRWLAGCTSFDGKVKSIAKTREEEEQHTAMTEESLNAISLSNPAPFDDGTDRLFGEAEVVRSLISLAL